MAKFSPLHDRILVRRVEEASTTRGGIIIPDSAKASRKREKSSPPAKAAPTMKARPSLSPFTKATASCSANTPAPKSRSMAKTSSS